ncbi:mapk-regulated corepressor-interacting protein 1 isoform X3 [Myotis daubentonii]|nr:mapk-regulated corepressor-interacting protein 1 isoform X3 [Myotis daubentonii]
MMALSVVLADKQPWRAPLRWWLHAAVPGSLSSRRARTSSLTPASRTRKLGGSWAAIGPLTPGGTPDGKLRLAEAACQARQRLRDPAAEREDQTQR